jgi:hypothetical protein
MTTTTRPGRRDAFYAPLETAAANFAARLNLSPSYLHASRATGTGTVEHLHLRMNTLRGKQFIGAVVPTLAGPELALADDCPVCHPQTAPAVSVVEYAKAA